MLLSTDKDSVKLEMQEKTNPYQNKYEFLRNPIIADFLGMEENREYLEMLCANRFENWENNTSRCRADGHVCSDV